jgi:hypothetical protein
MSKQLNVDTFDREALFFHNAGAATTITGTSGTVRGGTSEWHTINAVITEVAGTSPTLDLRVDGSMDGSTWVQSVATFAQIDAAGKHSQRVFHPNYTHWRVVATTGGSNPVFTGWVFASA